MADSFLLGLFTEPTPAAQAIEGLRQAGVGDRNITVMSNVPYDHEMLGRRPARDPMRLLAVGGGLLGFVVAIFLTTGIFLLYQLDQGGQPLIPIPPSLIIIFETMMLGIMWAIFFGFLFVNRMPIFGRPVYDPRISDGYIGVLAKVRESSLQQAEEALRDNDAKDVQRTEVTEQVNRRAWIRFLGAAGTGLVVTVVIALLFWYGAIQIKFPTQMDNQISIAYVQGPRLAAPPSAVPIQGPVMISGQPATEPVAATQDSIDRGRFFFKVNCAMCHGQTGAGDGELSGYFSPRPPALLSAGVKAIPDSGLFTVITNGLGEMPSLAENLSPEDTWDVINYVRSLQK